MFKDIIYTRGYMGERNPPDWSWEFDHMEDFDIWFVRGGRGIFRGCGHTINLSRGACIVIPPGSAASVEQEKADPLHTVAVHFLLKRGKNITLPLFCRIEEEDFFESLMSRTVRAAWSGDDEGAARWLSCVIEVLMQSVAGSGGQRPRKDEIEAVCRKILFQPERDWKVSDMAEKTFLCRERFSRLFREIKGVPPQMFIIQARVAKACRILKSTELPLSEVAKSCGYNSEFFFNRQFKSLKKMSPGRFRRTYSST